MDINAAGGGAAGLSREKIEVALGARPDAGDVLAPRERLALEYADRVSATPVDVPDEFFARLRAEFSEREIVELTAHIAFENANAKMNRPLRIESNNFCALPLPPPQK
jgi:alkylhydroperoxidase family enzyme